MTELLQTAKYLLTKYALNIVPLIFVFLWLISLVFPQIFQPLLHIHWNVLIPSFIQNMGWSFHTALSLILILLLLFSSTVLLEAISQIFFPELKQDYLASISNGAFSILVCCHFFLLFYNQIASQPLDLNADAFFHFSKIQLILFRVSGFIYLGVLLLLISPIWFPLLKKMGESFVDIFRSLFRGLWGNLFSSLFLFGLNLGLLLVINKLLNLAIQLISI